MRKTKRTNPNETKIDENRRTREEQESKMTKCQHVSLGRKVKEKGGKKQARIMGIMMMPSILSIRPSVQRPAAQPTVISHKENKTFNVHFKSRYTHQIHLLVNNEINQPAP